MPDKSETYVPEHRDIKSDDHHDFPEGPPGPPIAVRLSPEDVEEILKDYGFEKQKVIGIGEYNYLMLFHLGR